MITETISSSATTATTTSVVATVTTVCGGQTATTASMATPVTTPCTAETTTMTSTAEPAGTRCPVKPATTTSMVDMTPSAVCTTRFTVAADQTSSSATTSRWEPLDTGCFNNTSTATTVPKVIRTKTFSIRKEFVANGCQFSTAPSRIRPWRGVFVAVCLAHCPIRGLSI